uniref:SpvB/TcaC N-terminal domain-containing protein n=1 Tax=Prevotella conceptionensis TaxID=340486 RepID=UPI0005C57228
MKRLIHITLATAIALLSLASCNDGSRTSRGMDAQGEVKRQIIHHAEQKADKGSVVPNAKNGIGGTLVTRKVQGRETNKGLSRLRSFRRRTVSKLFARDAADSLHLGRAQLHVPSGSMERAKLLSVTPLGKGELPHLPAGMVNVTGDRDVPVSASLKGGVAGYRLLPHGEHFVHAPATITVPYDSALIPKGYTADDIHTYYYDELQGKWTMLRHKALDREREVVMAETSHFTDVINGIIKVPESPETQNYVPTGIAELKAADPAAGITTVNAPTPNQSGTASLGYAFELPKGRGSMQPAVGLQYGSDGGSSYVGYGWSLPVQSVDIETRWGVPRFDIEHESESYLLMGTKLGDRTYRTAELPGRAKDKRFKPLVEGGFARIIGKGDLPTNYTWEVTSKDGTTSYFGGIGGKIVDNAVIKDAAGNIVRWALYRTVDTHGNFVSYTYEHHDSTLYPKCYRYTGHDDEAGAYAVNFDYAPAARRDAMSSGRLGVLQRDDRLLQRVNVTFNNESVRSYALHHREGPFAKTLLDSIVQLDAKGARVAAQGFDYYDDVKGGMFGKAESWTSEADSKHEHLPPLQKAINGFSNELSMLGGGYSKGRTLGGGLLVGFGVSVATVNVGASYIHSKNENFGKVALIDIDGDGLPDKLFQARDGLRYRKNLSGETGNPIFAKSRMIKGIGEFSRGTSSSKTLNADAAVELPFVSPGVSYSRTWDKTETKIYLSDFNNDGLVDIANNGMVWFNRIGTDGLPTFIPSTKETPNPIVGRSAEIDSTFIPDYKAIRDSLEKENPLHDVVRVWRAPFSGTIRIASVVNKSTTYGDGITYSIQKEENVLKRDSILSTGTRTDSLTTSVKAGERLFFRLQSRYSGAADSVAWSQRVEYSRIVGGNATYLGQDLSHYDAASDFLEGMTTGMFLPKDGRVEVKAPYRKGRTGSHVTLVVRRKDLHDEHILMEKKLPAGTSVEDTFEDAFDVLAKDSVQLTFEMLTDAPLEWRNMSWKPTLRYVSTQDTLRVIPFRKMYNKPVLVRASRNVRKDLAKNQKYDPGVILV